MPKKTAPPSSEAEIVRHEDSFGDYRSQVAEFLSQEERISRCDQKATVRQSNTAIGAGMSNLKKKNLNVLLRQCVRDLTPEIDEMQHRVSSMYLISQLGKKCPSSSPSLLQSNVPEEFREAAEDDIQLLLRPMTRGEKRDLQKSIKELPERNLERIAEIVGSHCIASGKDFSDEVKVNLDELDNIMLWRLHFYVRAVKSAQKLAG